MVAKQYTQTYGVVYEKTFSLARKKNIVQAVHALVAHFVWELHPLDMKNVFLHETLEKQVYTEIPPGFKTHIRRNKACLLKKTLYGLKQCPKVWFGRFTKAMIFLGYKESQRDHNSFIQYSYS